MRSAGVPDSVPTLSSAWSPALSSPHRARSSRPSSIANRLPGLTPAGLAPDGRFSPVEPSPPASPPPIAPAHASAFCGVAFAAALPRCLPVAAAGVGGLPAAASAASVAPCSSAGAAATGEAPMSCGSAEAAPKVPGDRSCSAALKSKGEPSSLLPWASSPASSTCCTGLPRLPPRGEGICEASSSSSSLWLALAFSPPALSICASCARCCGESPAAPPGPCRFSSSTLPLEMPPAPCAPLARARDGRRFLAPLALASSSSVLPSPSPSDASEPAFITTATLSPPSLTAIVGSSSALVSWGGASSAPKLAVTFSWLSRFRLAFLPGVLSPPGEAGGLALGLGMRSSGVMCGGVASASPLASCSRCSRFARRIAELYLFLMALSVRPGISLTIWLQRVPNSRTLSMITRSSSAVHEPFLTSGHRWLNHRSLHCFPIRPGR
mmetsp:Transcript_37975/g.96451  ORF Transcript_37975/g.96451 Transcript_37975/m.96451 type:complete len:439 (-) Transcript_37975:365-1681(-)